MTRTLPLDVLIGERLGNKHTEGPRHHKLWVEFDPLRWVCVAVKQRPSRGSESLRDREHRDSSASQRHTAIEDVIFAAFEDVGKSFPPARMLHKDASTPIIGDGGILDSLAFVSLIIEIERRLGELFGTMPSLLDASTDITDSPFESIGTLTNFVANLISKRETS